MTITKKKLKEFEYFVNRPQSVQRDNLIATVMSVPALSIYSDGYNRDVYMESRATESRYRKLKEILKTKKGWKKHLDFYQELKKEVLACRELSLDSLSCLSDFELLKLMKGNYSLVANNTDYIMAPFMVEGQLDPECRELLAKHYDNHEKIFEIISSPKQMIMFQRMRIDICKARIEFSQKKIDKLVHDYAWYSLYNYTEKLLDEKYFKKEISKLSLVQARREIKEIKDHLRKNNRNYSSWKKTVKDPKLFQIADIISTYVTLRTDRIDVLKLAQYGIYLGLQETMKRLKKASGEKWKMSLMISLLDKEVLDFLEKNIIPDIREVEKRTPEAYVYYYDGKNSRLITNKGEIKMIQNFFKSEDEVKEFKGMSSFRGKCRGRVALVLNRSHLKKIKTDSILVARSTMVDYISGMRKALAFVTDEGGVTCHAAITARELKKPCIVGAKIATQVLQNGDLVEVNANEGVVKIIKRKR